MGVVMSWLGRPIPWQLSARACPSGSPRLGLKVHHSIQLHPSKPRWRQPCPLRPMYSAEVAEMVPHRCHSDLLPALQCIEVQQSDICGSWGAWHYRAGSRALRMRQCQAASTKGTSSLSFETHLPAGPLHSKFVMGVADLLISELALWSFFHALRE